MGCGCGKAKRSMEPNTVSARWAGATTSAGIYELYGYEECTEPYRGVGSDEKVFIVARRTPQQRLFRQFELTAASDYARSIRQPMVQVPAKSLCSAAGADLFGVPAS